MLSTTMLLTMFEYNYQTNNRLLDLAAKATPEEWDAPQEAGQRSLHATLFHLLTVEEEWIEFCEHGKPNFDYRNLADYPDVASLRAFSDQTYQVIHRYLEGMTETLLTSTVHGKMPADVGERTATIWHLLIHTLYHSAQHRSEVASMLTRYHLSPGEIDFFGFGCGWW
ncbi:MAG TPA: DinB family protein [Phototrophicaceae bacterium]|nr:DinB family protein [Phototrophicaceae bacterium]